MIAADSSSLIAFLEGDGGSDIDALDNALSSQVLILPPVVLTEILSDPMLPKHVAKMIVGLPMLEILPGYWERAGQTRAKIISKARSVRVADALIAQSCLDYDIPLITRDKDFRHFEKFANLKVIW
jgi:hypothetical protein